MSTLVNFNIYSPPPKFFLSWLTTGQLIAKTQMVERVAQYGSQFIHSQSKIQ